MIQRIQSVYLLIVIILTSLLNGFSLMELISPESLLTVKVWGVYNGNVLDYSLWPLLVLLILNSILALIAIAIYKNRILQIRACILNILLIIGFYIMLGGYYWIFQEKYALDIILKWPLILPAINIILLYLSIRAIAKDEALVKAADRLR